MKTTMVLFIVALILVGCENKDEMERIKIFHENNKKSWEACLSSGGVPLQSWYSSEVLGDCKYKEEKK